MAKLETLGLNDPKREQEHKQAFEKQKAYLDLHKLEEAEKANGITGEKYATTVEKSRIEKEGLPEQLELFSKEEMEAGNRIISETVQKELAGIAKNPNLTEQQKADLENKDFQEAVAEQVRHKSSFGTKTANVVGKIAGGRIGTFIAGVGVSALVRKGIIAVAPGWGYAAAAGAGAASGGFRAWRGEVMRVKGVQQDLESIKDKEPIEKIQQYMSVQKELENKKLTGVQKNELRAKLEGLAAEIKGTDWKEAKGRDKIKRLIQIREEASKESFASDKESREILAQLDREYSTKIDKRKIAIGALRGAVYGAAGAYMGGLVMDWFGHISHDHGTVVKVGEGLGKRAKEFWSQHAPNQTLDGTRPMDGNVWNTVKNFFHEHGVANPSDKMLNEATRRIADLNNIEITGDHAGGIVAAAHHHLAEGVRDVAMPQQNLIGFDTDKLGDLLYPDSNAVQHAIGASHPGEHLQMLMQEQHPSLKDIQESVYSEEYPKILTALGLVGAADAALVFADSNMKGSKARERKMENNARKAASKLASQESIPVAIQAVTVEKKPEGAMKQQFESAMAILAAIEEDFRQGRISSAYEKRGKVWQAFNIQEVDIPQEQKNEYFSSRHEVGAKLERIFAEQEQESYGLDEKELKRRFDKSMEVLNSIEKQLPTDPDALIKRREEIWQDAFPRDPIRLHADAAAEHKKLKEQLFKRFNELAAYASRLRQGMGESKTEKIKPASEPVAQEQAKETGVELEKWQDKVDDIYFAIEKSQIRTARKLKNIQDRQTAQEVYRIHEKFWIEQLNALGEVPKDIKLQLADEKARFDRLVEEEAKFDARVKSLFQAQDKSAQKESVLPTTTHTHNRIQTKRLEANQSESNRIKEEATEFGADPNVWRALIYSNNGVMASSGLSKEDLDRIRADLKNFMFNNNEQVILDAFRIIYHDPNGHTESGEERLLKTVVKIKVGGAPRLRELENQVRKEKKLNAKPKFNK